jgi:hypothetical protein
MRRDGPESQLLLQDVPDVAATTRSVLGVRESAFAVRWWGILDQQDRSRGESRPIVLQEATKRLDASYHGPRR